ncbi:hypothetical protein AgCh_004963 [Apium graveolens]
MVRSIRILLEIAGYYDYEIWKMDVKTAFLNGSLEEDVYMIQPEGFVDPKFAKMVCKLLRSIYGLKQASRRWNHHFDETVKEFGFIQNGDEPCVYKKVFKTWLGNRFSMKDLGDATYILGIKIYRDRSRKLIGLSQSIYIDKVLHRFGMQEAKKGYVPMSHGILISKDNYPKSLDDKGRMSKVPYASAIGSIMYVMICTRLDVSYALSMTRRYQSNPSEGHWTAVKNIRKYLKRTKDSFLVYGGDEKLVVKGYTDASFQTDRDDSVSQSGFVFCLNGGAVSWKSSKKDTVADSTMEAEYIVVSEAAKEAVWIRKFITGLGVVPSITDLVNLYCDNNRAIAQDKEPRYGYMVLMKNKSDSFEMFKEYKAEVEKQTWERELLSKKISGRIIHLDEYRESHDNIEPNWERDPDVHQYVESNHVQETRVVRRSSRIHHEPERYYEFLLIQDGDVMLTNNDKPLIYQDAMNSPDSERWLEGQKVKKGDIDEFIDSLDTPISKIHNKITPLRNTVLLGDTILHLAAICGHLEKNNETLIGKLEERVVVNDDGNTPFTRSIEE